VQENAALRGGPDYSGSEIVNGSIQLNAASSHYLAGNFAILVSSADAPF
jgi:hypothetical protein